jgi:hypothetical protein
MATQKYVNTEKNGMGVYADTPGKQSKVVGGTQSKAGAGRGFVNPKRTDESDDTYVTPADRMAMEKATSARKTEAATEAAYNKASGMKKGGSVDGIAQRGKTRGRMC